MAKSTSFTWLLGAALVATGVGCGKVHVFDLDEPPVRQTLNGKFNFATSGYAYQIGELANNPSQAQKKTSMSLATSGNILVSVEADQVVFSVASFVASPSQTGTPQPPATPGEGWEVHCKKAEIGLATSFSSSRALTPEELFASKCLVSYWEPNAPQGALVNRQELDGEYESNYQKGEGPNTMVLTWISASDVLPALASLPNRTAIPITRQVYGNLQWTRTAGKGLTAKGRRVLLSFLNNKQVGENSLDIDYSLEPVKGSSPKQPAKPVPYKVYQAPDAMANERALQVKFLGEETLFSILRSIPEKPLPAKERNDRFLKLRAFFYLRPEEADEAIKGPLSREQKMLIAEALVGAGNSVSQDAFSTLLMDNIKSPDFEPMVALVIPLVNIGSPLRMTLDWAMFKSEYRYSTQLVIGSNIRRCLTINPKQADWETERLLHALTSSKKEDDQINALYALGNAGNEAAIETQQRYLDSVSADVRAAAVHSFRHFSSTTTLKDLTALQSTEKDEKVLAELKRVIGAIKERQ